MKRLKYFMLAGVFFVLAAGSLSHFLYEWTGNDFLTGLFCPVNESTWEHMKLLFFPMLLYSLLIAPMLKRTLPDIAPDMSPSLMAGNLAGTWAIPVIFYTYTGILGQNLFFLDLMTFFLSVILAFYLACRLALSGKMQRFSSILYMLTVILLLCFWMFTYDPPNMRLFAEPEFFSEKFFL